MHGIILHLVLAFLTLCISLFAFNRRRFELAVFAGFWAGFNFAIFIGKVT
jgi:hypothetical protein